MFAYCVSAAVSRSRFRGASQAPALRVTSSAHGCGRRILSRSLALPHHRDMAPFIPLWNECRRHFGLAGPRAERSSWSWASTLEIRPDLDHDEIAGWRRRGHRDADARRGARFYPGRWALPHHRDMAPFIPLWNECRRHLGLAGRLHPSRHVESGAMRTACSLAPSDARNTRRPAETPHRGHESADARDAGLAAQAIEGGQNRRQIVPLIEAEVPKSEDERTDDGISTTNRTGASGGELLLEPVPGGDEPPSLRPRSVHAWGSPYSVRGTAAGPQSSTCQMAVTISGAGKPTAS